MAYEEIEYDMYGDPIYPDEGSSSESEKVVDAFGNRLASGDTVQLTRELPVKGTKVTLKKGTKVKNIRLTDNIEEISANIPEVKGLVLRTEFVKKI